MCVKRCSNIFCWVKKRLVLGDFRIEEIRDKDNGTSLKERGGIEMSTAVLPLRDARSLSLWNTYLRSNGKGVSLANMNHMGASGTVRWMTISLGEDGSHTTIWYILRFLPRSISHHGSRSGACSNYILTLNEKKYNCKTVNRVW